MMKGVVVLVLVCVLVCVCDGQWGIDVEVRGDSLQLIQDTVYPLLVNTLTQFVDSIPKQESGHVDVKDFSLTV